LAQPETPSQQVPDYYELGMARLLVSKMALSQYAVESKDFVIQYVIYNIGDKPAVRVSLDDKHAFSTAYFDLVAGTLHAKWARIAPGQNVTHSVVLRPRETGAFNITTAIVSYQPGDGDEVRYATSSAPGEIYIYRQRDYDKKFSGRYADWFVFALMASPCIGLPALLWYNTYKKYDLSKKNKAA
jgi:translocon-associated protein subunit beta